MTKEEEILAIKDKPAVIAHVEMMQSIISRMAENSAKCKEWCFTLIGAIMAYFLSTSTSLNADILYWLATIFCVTDAFYLGLERSHKNNLNTFLNKINSGEPIADDIFFPRGVKPSGSFNCVPEKKILQLWGTFKALFSLSILLPYGLLFLAICKIAS